MKRATIWGIICSQILFLSLYSVWWKLTTYLHPIVIPVIWLCLTGMILFIAYYFQRIVIFLDYRLIGIGLFFYSVGLLILLFFRPSNQSYNHFNLIPFQTIFYFLFQEPSFLVAFYNLAANVALFVPFGVFIPFLVSLGKRTMYIVPVLIISTIELLQMFSHRGSLDIDDLLLNLIGIYLGYFLSGVVGRVIKIK
ncbi:VanZ family protein [Bacillus sp. AK128]